MLIFELFWAAKAKKLPLVHCLSRIKHVCIQILCSVSLTGIYSVSMACKCLSSLSLHAISFVSVWLYLKDLHSDFRTVKSLKLFA